MIEEQIVIIVFAVTGIAIGSAIGVLLAFRRYFGQVGIKELLRFIKTGQRNGKND